MEKAAAEPAVDLAKEHGPYYYAHAAKAWEVPEDAKTISGEGLTHTGQGPRRLDGDAATEPPAADSVDALQAEMARLRARLADAARVRRPETVPPKKYAFADGEETCKIYVEFAAGELADAVSCGLYQPAACSSAQVLSGERDASLWHALMRKLGGSSADIEMLAPKLPVCASDTVDGPDECLFGDS